MSLSGTLDSNAGAAAAFDAGAVDASKSFDILVLDVFSEVRPAQCMCTTLMRAFHLRQVLHVLVAIAASHGVEFSDAILCLTISLFLRLGTDFFMFTSILSDALEIFHWKRRPPLVLVSPTSTFSGSDSLEQRW